MDGLDEYAQVVAKRWRALTVGALLGVGLAWGVTQALPPEYEWQTVLLYATPPSTGSLTLSESPAPFLSGIANSTRVRLAISEATRLTLRELEGQYQVDADAAKNQIILKARGGDDKHYQTILSTARREYDAAVRESGNSLATRQAAELDAALQRRRDERRRAEASLVAFQQTMKTASDPANPVSSLSFRSTLKQIELDLESTERQLVLLRKRLGAREAAGLDLGRNPFIEQLRGQWLNRQVAADAARQTLGPENPERLRLEREATESRATLERELEKAYRMASLGLTDDLIHMESERAVLRWQRDAWQEMADAAPDEAMTLLRLAGEVRAIDAIIASLEARRNELSLQSKVDRFQSTVLLDASKVPFPVNKDFALNGLVGGFLGLMAAGAIAMTRSRPQPAQSA